MFGIFSALAEFERELMVERTKAGLASVRARGEKGGAPFKMTPAKLQLAQVAMSKKDMHGGQLYKELAITRQTLYRYVEPDGSLRGNGKKLLSYIWKFLKIEWLLHKNIYIYSVITNCIW